MKEDGEKIDQDLDSGYSAARHTRSITAWMVNNLNSIQKTDWRPTCCVAALAVVSTIRRYNL